MTKPSEEDVAAFIALKKSLLRVMEWTERSSVKNPQWLQFESKCYLGTTLSDEIQFRAHYRPAANVVKGGSILEIPEAFYVSVSIREHRVFAIDTLPGQRHPNKGGVGRPFFKKIVDSTTHVHLWTEKGYGYVEPIEPPILELKDAIAEFCGRVNLWINGEFVHPLHYQQLKLLQ
jgi:hypothetical protein